MRWAHLENLGVFAAGWVLSAGPHLVSPELPSPQPAERRKSALSKQQAPEALDDGCASVAGGGLRGWSLQPGCRSVNPGPSLLLPPTGSVT